jgi:mercuric reductase
MDSVPYLTSTSALALDRLPKSLLVIGGGVIGVELGQMFSRLGVDVTICCRSRLLPEMDPEVSAALKNYLEAEGVRVCAGVGYQRIAQTQSGVELTCEGHCDTVAAEQVLIATGRRPNSDGLGLEERGIVLARNGGIVVDDHLETSVPGIYAAGDVTGRDQFVYMAAYGAKLAARNAVTGNQYRYDNSSMPSVVFTDPQVASAGLTETTARAQGLDIKVSLLARCCAKGTGSTRYAGSHQTDCRQGERPFAGRPDHGTRRRGFDPDTGAGDQTRHDHPGIGCNDISLPDHCGRPQTGGPNV